MSENPPDPWRGDDEWWSRRWLDELRAIEDVYAVHLKFMREFYRGNTLIWTLGMSTISFVVGISVGEGDWWAAARAVRNVGLGMLGGYVIASLPLWYRRWKRSRIYGPKEWRCPQCKTTRRHKMDCTNRERNR